ncbi:MAG: flavin reductase family protein [Clostridia bacterium]|nr:flavin reductase family protein [Clostridia bacterium]
MEKFYKTEVEKINENPFTLIGREWMLVTATDKNGGYNTMTASWGGLGVLWGKNVAFVFIRPQRYTREFADSSDTVTLSFFPEEYRSALSFCGSHSGRDFDKAAETGITPVLTDSGAVTFEESRLVLEGRKLYRDALKEECFIDSEALSHYKAGDFHYVYVYEITEVYRK